MKPAVVLLAMLSVTAGLAGCLDPTIKDGALQEYTQCRVFFFFEVSPVRLPCQEIGVQAPTTDTLPSGYACVEQHSFDGGLLLIYAGLDPNDIVLGLRFDQEVDAIGGLIRASYDLSEGEELFRWTAAPDGDGVFVELHLSEPFAQQFTLAMTHATSVRTMATEPLDSADIDLSWAVTVEDDDLEPRLVHRFRADGGPYFFVTNEPRTFDGADFELQLQPTLIDDTWRGPPSIGPTSSGCAS